MFQATNSPILRSSLTVYTAFWYNAPTLLPIGALYQKAVYTVKRAPEDGRVCRPKYVGLI